MNNIDLNDIEMKPDSVTFVPDNQKLTDLLTNIKEREMNCWTMAQTFLDNRDAHGIHDMGVEIQALERSRKELEKLK